jgi:hypothetical protein
MTFPVDTIVIRLGQSEPNLGTVIQSRRGSVEIEYIEGGTGWWPVEALEAVEDPNPPQWIAFGAALGGDQQVNEFYGGLIQQAPVLYMMVGGGLLQAAQGDPRTFLTAWALGLQSGLVTPALAAHVAELAAPFDLPADFVAALTAPPAP